MSDMLATLPEYSAFASTLGSVYSLLETGDGASGGVAAVLTLSEVSPQLINSGFSSYSLIFQSKTPGVHEQGCYSLHHEQLGVLEIFLVPIRCVMGLTEFEAVFSQSVFERLGSED